MAENKDGQEKTEQATGKRLGEARDRGQVAKSTDITTAAVLLIGGTMVFVLGRPMLGVFKDFMRDIFIKSAFADITTQNTTSHYSELILLVSKLVLPILLVVMLIGAIAEISQVGFHFASKKFTEGLNFKSILNPFGGIKRMFFSGRSYFELAKSLIKVTILSTVVYQVISSRTDETLQLMNKPFSEIGAFIASVSLEVLLKTAGIFAIIAAGDFLYQKYRYKEDMKMTKQEVKEEGKQSEGDPKIKGKIRSLMRQRLKSIMMKSVQTADVVITNPTHFAVALRYKPETMSAPKVVAKGADYIALQIRLLAKEADIPIIEEPPLARALYYSVEIEQEIPEKLFKAVAQILAYVYQLKNKVS